MRIVGGQIWVVAKELVDRIPTQKGLDLFTCSVFQDMHSEDMEYAAKSLTELAAEKRKEEAVQTA